MIFWKKDNVDLEKRRKIAQEAYGIEHPEKIQGFEGYFGFTFGDIYIDEDSFALLQRDKDFEGIVDACLALFRDSDYGRKTRREERELNSENRLFFGLNCGLVGRYETRYGILEIQVPEVGVTEIELWACSPKDRKPLQKRLFKANVKKVCQSQTIRDRLENEREIILGEVWDGDLEKLIRNKYSREMHPENFSFYKTYPYGPLDKNGIGGDDEMYVMWNDGDFAEVLFYFTKPLDS